jgi:hypothetical protein
MAGRASAKYSRNAKARRSGVVIGGALSAFVAAAAMATGSAAPAKADFEDLLDPIIQPLLTSFTDSLSAIDPAAAVDLTSWTDSLLSSLSSLDAALPAASEPAAAVAASAEPAASGGTYDLPITVEDNPATEPAVGATVDGASTNLLVDTGSSGLVIPYTDLDPSNSVGALEDLFSLGSPTSYGESGYTGGVEYIYATYDSAPVNYDLSGGGTLDTTAPIEVELYSWDPSNLFSFFTNDAFQDFLTGNGVTGILGIGDGADGGAGVSPLESAGYDGVTVDVPAKELIVGGATNPFTAIDTLANSGATPNNELYETVSNGGVVSDSSKVSDDVDSGGVFGTIPSGLSSDVEPGSVITVYSSQGGTELYSYIVGPETNGISELPTSTSGTSIDSGYPAFENEPIYIDYTAHTLSFDK